LKTTWKKRCTAGFLAVLLGCSSLLAGGSSAFAAPLEQTDVKEETQAEDITIEQGETFDPAFDFIGITVKDGEKVSLVLSADKEGKLFDADRPGRYDCIYQVQKPSGDTYEITRKIIVKEAGKEGESPQKEKKQKKEIKSGEEDAEPDGANIDTSALKEEEGVLFSVVPSSMEQAREKASLVQGERIVYPSDLGSYSTCYFYVNERIAYCLESNLQSPPSSDYVAEIYESNLNLQKVLYYGYGGPGDLTGEYLKNYSNDIKYVLTHLAASYCYGGEEVAFVGCTQDGLKRYGVMEYINYLCGQEAPPSAAISLSSTNETAFLEGDVQKTKNITLNGDHRNYITLSLPEGVTYHDTAGKEQKGGSIKIYGGTTFYFTAEKTVHGTWNSGDLGGQVGAQWKTLVVSTGSGNQDVGYGDFYEEPSTKVSFSIQWMDISWIEVIKEDAKSSVKLAGAVFGIYRDQACTDLILEMPPTDEKGATKAELTKTQDTVYIKEITAPKGYKLNTTAYNVNLEVAKTQTLTVKNEEQKGKIIIRKQGEKLTGVSGEAGNLQFTYTNAAFAGAKYKIYAAEDIYSQDKQTKIYQAGDLAGELETKEDGSCSSDMLHLGTYKVVEQQAPDSLTIGKTEEERTHMVTLSYAGQTVEVVEEETQYENARPKVSVEVLKKSSNDDAALKGAIFGLYADEDVTGADGSVLVTKGTMIQKAESNENGKAAFTADIPIGFHYVVKEIQAPPLYVQSSDSYEFFYEYKNDTTYTYTFAHTFKNKEVRGAVHIKKIDKDTQDSVSQGDGDLNGAVYGLYAAEDIQHPNGKTGLLYKKDQLVVQGTIEKGVLNFKDLYLGKYYVQEISAPPSNAYLLDQTKYPVDLAYEGQDVEIVQKNVTVLETIKKQAFQLIKISDDGSQTETELLEGAGFKVYLISELSKVKDGTLKPSNGTEYAPQDFIGYDFSKEETASYYENGEKIQTEEMFTDKKGYLCSPELPYGKYVCIESTIPENVEGIQPFLVTIDEDSREPQTWRVFNDRPMQFYFKIIKKDAQTELPILKNSAHYKIYDVEKKKYVTMKVRYPKPETIDVFETNEEGYLLTPEPLKMGTYRIEEVKSPELFVQTGFEQALKNGEEILPLNEVTKEGTYEKAPRESITIKVDSNTAHEVEEETGKYIVVVEVKNDEAVGSLTIQKTGEVLVGAEKVTEQILTKLKNGLAKAVNQVSNLFTGEDVMETEKGYEFAYEEQGLAGAEFSIYARETIYSPDGQVDSEGNRIIRFEKGALVGTIVTDGKGKGTLNNLPIGKFYIKETKTGDSFVLDPAEQDFEITYKGQEVAVDYVTKEIKNQRQKVEIEVLKKSEATKEPLEGVSFGLYAGEDIVNAAGKVVVKKDELVAVEKTDQKGKLKYSNTIPHGKYYLKELEGLPGYLPYEEKIEIDASYTDPELEVISIQKEVENQPTKVEVTKTDITGEKEVEGARLQIQDEEGTVVEEWTSTNESHIIYALKPGKYILHEEQAPTENGYVKAEDVEFTVEETGEIQKVSMKDDHTKIEITKTDITGEQEIEGAKLQVLDEEGNIIEEWTSTKEPYRIEYLQPGKTYILHEEAAPEGFLIAEDVEFTVEETGEVQKVSMKDEVPMGQLIIKKTDAEDQTPLANVEFELKNKETEEVVGKLTTDKDGVATSELLPIATYEDGKAVGPITYVLSETKPLEGYEEHTETYEITFSYVDAKTKVIEVVKEIQNKKLPQTPEKPEDVKTGDNTLLLLPIGIAVVAAFGIGIVLWRIRRTKR
jgi:uncharacterized surface anchored protein